MGDRSAFCRAVASTGSQSQPKAHAATLIRSHPKSIKQQKEYAK